MILSKEGLFNCSGCKKEVKSSLYAIAQIASGFDIIYSCDCGSKTKLEGFGGVENE